MNPVELLTQLIRYNTVNPPGNETACVAFLAGLLQEAGLEVRMMGRSPNRQNLLACLEGSGDAPPLLMYGHADVVAASRRDWKHDPFEGIVADGCVWGRGTLDMKGGLAMMTAALLQARASGIKPRGDILFSALCDEEVEGEYGAVYLTREWSHLFTGVRYAIGEIGGFTLHLGERRFYPIMVSEKQTCVVRATIRGVSGHGSVPVKKGAMASLGRLLTHLNAHPLPVHITAPAAQMIDALSGHMTAPEGFLLKLLKHPVLAGGILSLLGERGSFFEAILRNTANPTLVRGGEKINVIPDEIILEMDGRLLPGFKPEDLLTELKAVAGEEVEWAASSYVPGPEKVDMGLFETLGSILREGDPKALPMPFMAAGVTDARYFCRLGIQTYGFTPMLLPKGMDFMKLLHAADERIPTEALIFGSHAILELIKRYRG